MHSFRNERPHAALALLAAFTSASWLASCSPSTGQAGLGGGSGSQGSSAGAGSSGSSGGDGSGSSEGSGNSSFGGALFSSGGDNGGGDLGADAGCATEVHQGERQPLDMYFLVDQSGSMNDGSPSKWAAVSGSLDGFVADPANAGTSAGIGYFPYTTSGNGQCTSGQSGCTCIPFINICFSATGGSCTASDYATPDVGIGLLPGVGPAISTSLGNHGPGGGTPTYPALQGAYQYATGWAQSHLGEKTVVVLATDGDPNGCDADDVVGTGTTPGTIAGDLVAPALAGNPTANPPVPSIPTFVIGVGSSLTSLNALAQAGGTQTAFIVDTGGNVGQQFAAALDQIRGQAISCDFGVPNDGTVDPTKVNVTYSPPNAGSSDVFQVPTSGDCAAAGDSTANDEWFFDTGNTQLTLCPNTCQKLAQGGGTVQVVLGCPTKIEKIQ